MSTDAAEDEAWSDAEGAREQPRRDWTAERIAVLRRRWAEGASAGTIGNELGVSRSAALGKIFRLGLPAPAVKQPRASRKGKRRTLRRRQRAANHPAPSLGASSSELEAAYAAFGLGKSDSLDESAAPAEASQAFGNPCTLLDLSEDTCRWPVGEPGRPGFAFCGAAPFRTRPYCLAHCLIAYRAPDGGRAPRLRRRRSRVFLCLAARAA